MAGIFNTPAQPSGGVPQMGCSLEAGVSCGARIWEEYGSIPDSKLDQLIRKAAGEREAELAMHKRLSPQGLARQRSIFCENARFEYQELELIVSPLLPCGGRKGLMPEA